MKKISLAFMLSSMPALAQETDEFYCSIDSTGTIVEQITSIDFSNTNIIDSNSSNAIIIDKTTKKISVIAGETYSLSVAGDTKGNFKNEIVAYIDWNQNGFLDDDSEIYELGSIYNSNGHDNKPIALDIDIPQEALEGPTRIRVIKSYTNLKTIAKTNPCAIKMNVFGQKNFPGYGQVVDFTLDVRKENLGLESLDVEALIVYPVPTTNILNIEYNSDIHEIEVYNLVGRKVHQTKTSNSKVQIDLSALRDGNYIILLKTEKGQYSFQIIKKQQ